VERTKVKQPSHIRVDLDQTHVRGNLQIAKDPQAVGGQCIVLDTSAKNGSIEIPLTVPPGRYLVWVRAKSRGRYQIARLEVKGAGRGEKCLVTGVGEKLFSDYTWSWRRVQSLSGSTVPRRTPMWITVAGDHPTLSIRYESGYLELDQIYLSTSVHDLPAAEAIHFKPVDEYRFAVRTISGVESEAMPVSKQSSIQQRIP
jgi:hypothetical protein